MPAASEEVDPSVFSGTFRFVGGDREREAMAEAVERAVQALPSFFHSLARKRLGRANIIPRKVTMTMIGDELEIRYGDDLQPMRAPLDGTVRSWRNREGDHVNIKMELRGRTLVQTTWNSGGRRVMRWKPSDDGKRMRMHSVTTSPRLPVAIDYRLTFRE